MILVIVEAVDQQGLGEVLDVQFHRRFVGVGGGVHLRLQGQRGGIERDLRPGARVLHRGEVDGRAGSGDEHDCEDAEEREEGAAFVVVEPLEKVEELLHGPSHPNGSLHSRVKT